MNKHSIDLTMDRRSTAITERILDKIVDYERYAFTRRQDSALKTFFDLAQEYEEQSDFYRICVLIPKVFFEFDCCLYLYSPKGFFELACAANPSADDLTTFSPAAITEILDGTVFQKDRFAIPIRGNEQLLSSLASSHYEGILGLFEVRSDTLPTDELRFFIEKYVNRIGFALHNRLITEKNREHLRFIRNLVNDIGHNVIVPNIAYRLFFRRLKGKIDRAGVIANALFKQPEESERSEAPSEHFEQLAREQRYVIESMERQFQEILNHYEQTSLFLETLLRQSHFEEGRYVIETKRVNFRERIVRPQLNLYNPRLKERGIAIDDQLSGITDEEIYVVADVGLISQAYANLFSNAVKYTREAIDNEGRPQKFVAVGMELLSAYFGPSRDGIKFNVFSTGPPIQADDVPRLFEEGYRGRNIEREYGTGHGLQFVKEVIDLHGGVAGYEATPLGNNFFFVLPR
jgi:signal transduction histidine kinase